MLIALCLILAVAVLVLAVLLSRARGQIRRQTARAEEQRRELDGLHDAVRDATAVADEKERERDDALERVQRSRRDAAEVANRLSAATARAEQLEADNRGLVEQNLDGTSRIEELEGELAGVRRTSLRASEGAGAPTFDGDVVWGLTLARIDRMWRVSVAAGVDGASPLTSGQSLLETAVGIEVDAAREDAGTIIELTYAGDGDVDGAAAATTVALVEELVAGVSRLADEADLAVTVTDDAVLVTVTATNDGSPVDVPGPADLLDAEGRYRIERQTAATGGRPGR